MTVYVQLNAIPAGVSIDESALGMVDASRQLNLPVMLKFNGIELHATPASSVNDVRGQYQDSINFRRMCDVVNRYKVFEDGNISGNGCREGQ